MRTAYINKENKVVYIAAFEEDKIQPDNKGKFFFTAGEYNPQTLRWNHTLGSGEEVFEVDGNGLNIGDIYEAPAPPAEPTEEEIITRKEAELQALEKELVLEFLREKTASSKEFTDYIENKAKEA